MSNPLEKHHHFPGNSRNGSHYRVGQEVLHRPTQKQQAWLVVYADLITVILTFFVLLQSLSIIDPIKFDLFTNRERIVQEIPFDERLKIVEEDEAIISRVRLLALEKEEARKARVNRLFKRIKRDIYHSGIKHLVVASVDERFTQVTLRIKSALLFGSGEGEIGTEGALIVEKLARIISKHAAVFTNVEGHTDNQPIRTPRYASNWELSSARAINVLKHMIAHGVNPKQALATGFGDEFPVANNGTEKGRAANRRILLHLSYEG